MTTSYLLIFSLGELVRKAGLHEDINSVTMLTFMDFMGGGGGGWKQMYEHSAHFVKHHVSEVAVHETEAQKKECTMSIQTLWRWVCTLLATFQHLESVREGGIWICLPQHSSFFHEYISNTLQTWTSKSNPVTSRVDRNRSYPLVWNTKERKISNKQTCTFKPSEIKFETPEKLEFISSVQARPFNTLLIFMYYCNIKSSIQTFLYCTQEHQILPFSHWRQEYPYPKQRHTYQ